MKLYCTVKSKYNFAGKLASLTHKRQGKVHIMWIYKCLVHCALSSGLVRQRARTQTTKKIQEPSYS